MTRQKENGLILAEKNGSIHLVLKLTIKRRMLWTLLTLLALVLIAFGSSLNEVARKIIIDFLLSAIQAVLFNQRHTKS